MPQVNPSTPLLDLIRRRIAQDGPMDMAEYMALCLGHPDYGYYMTRDPFGAGGDFTTAPEISQLFGEMIGVWLADMWIKSGRPSKFILLETGPGRGTLMADIMRATKRIEGFHTAAQIHLMEMSSVLRAVQKQALAGYDTRWIDGLEALESGIPVFVVGNEFLDALPVHQLEFRNGAWHERVVGLASDGALQIGVKDVDLSLLDDVPDHIRNARIDGVFETSRPLNQFLKSLNVLLSKQSGAALFVDYGHFTSSMGDTLQAVKSHSFVDIFDTPGLCDLTAHVDFENVARRAKRDGLTVHGPVTQGAFLKSLGIEFRAQKLIEALQPNSSSVCGIDEPKIEEIKSGLNRLIDTKHMGSLFKVIALTGDPAITPAGFHEGF